RPANGFNGIPSTFTFTSVRAQAIRTTPSSVVVGLVPAAVPILAAFSACGFWSACSHTPSKPAANPATAAMKMCLFMDRSSCVGDSTTCSPAMSSATPVPSRPLPVYHELIEMRLRIGLGPQAHLARLIEGVVLHIQILLAIDEALDVVAGHFDLDR